MQRQKLGSWLVPSGLLKINWFCVMYSWFHEELIHANFVRTFQYSHKFTVRIIYHEQKECCVECLMINKMSAKLEDYADEYLTEQSRSICIHFYNVLYTTEHVHIIILFCYKMMIIEQYLGQWVLKSRCPISNSCPCHVKLANYVSCNEANAKLSCKIVLCCSKIHNVMSEASPLPLLHAEKI